MVGARCCVIVCPFGEVNEERLRGDTGTRAHRPFPMRCEELLTAMQATGLTQKQFALETNVDRSHISQPERDVKSPALDMLFRPYPALEVHASEPNIRLELP